MFEIDQVSNGFIVHTVGRTEVFKTLDEVLSDALFHFEHRTETMGGDHYGKVIIERKLIEEKGAWN